MVVADETHHLAAPTLSQAMGLAGCRYRLGLSATPTRKDGLHPAIHQLIGPVAWQMKRPPVHAMRVHVLPWKPDTVPPSPTYTEAITHTATDGARTRALAVLVGRLQVRWATAVGYRPP